MERTAFEHGYLNTQAVLSSFEVHEDNHAEQVESVKFVILLR